MPLVSKLFVYPIKSLPGVPVVHATVISGGALEHDREFALFDPEGNFVNAKRQPKIQRIRASYDLASMSGALQADPQWAPQTFDLNEIGKLETWFSDFFGFSVTIRRNVQSGFPDDTDSPGPTIISDATLQVVSSWFPQLDPAQTGRRFRANIEISDVPAFWEDGLFGKAEEFIDFQIGEVALVGVNPCQRCAVPSRHPDTSEALENFQAIFARKREASMPTWAAPERFNHFYRLATNTRIPSTETGKRIRVGDRVSLPIPS
jgi:uncharacterized protein